VLTLLSFILGVVGRVLEVPLPLLYMAIAILTGLTYYYSYLYTALKTMAERIAVSKFMVMGKALSEKVISVYVTGAQALGFTTSLLITLGATLGLARGYVPPPVFVAAVVLTILFGVFMVFPGIYVSFTASARKTSCEIELPFLLMLFRVLGSTHLTLYDILNAVEKSRALKAWSEEVGNARKIASILNTSLLTAMGMVSENHPSKVVRDVFKRILSVSMSTGQLRDVVERVFGHIYTQLEARLSGLVEKFTIIHGILLFALLFTPIVFAVLIPLYGGSAAMAFLLPLAFSTLFFFLIYAVVSSIYPSAFALNPPRTLTYLSVVGFASPVTLVVFHALPIILGSSSSINTHLLALGILLSVTPCAILSEMWLRRASLYDRLVRLVSDAATTAISLGENFATVLERMAPRYGRGVEDLARRILLGYYVEPVRERLLREAPSLYHATFLEALFHALLMGAKPEMLKALTASYEQLTNVYSKLRSLARTQEVMLLGLTAMVSVFLGYMKTLFTSFYNLVKSVGGGSWVVNIQRYINFNPATYDALTCTILISLIFASVIVGKLRGGSPLYSFKTMLLLQLLYILGLEASSLLPIRFL